MSDCISVLFSLIVLVTATALQGQSPLSQTALPTTAGDIAFGNLTAQIEGEERIGHKRPLSITQEMGIADLLEMRGQLAGSIADYERAATIADRLVASALNDGRVYLTRAHSRATFHRFTDALDDLNRAEQLGVNINHTNPTRA